MLPPESADEPAEESISVHIQPARNGSAEALGAILDLARDYLLGVANRELGSQLQAKAGASDVVQETFLEAQRAFSRFKGESAQELLAWLRGILLNKMSELNRRYQGTEKRRVNREVPLEEPQSGTFVAHPTPPSDTPSPSSIVSVQEEARLVQQALEKLPEHYRQVIVWRQWDDLSFEEISVRLGRTTDAVRMLWWRAIERLQQEMDRPK